MIFSDESYRVDWNGPCMPNTLFFCKSYTFSSHSHKSWNVPISLVMSVRLSTHVSTASVGKVFAIFGIRDLTKICENSTDLVKIRQQYWTFNTGTSTHLCFWQLYEIFFSWTIVQREPIVAFPWQYIILEYCWQPHVAQEQYEGNYCWVPVATLMCVIPVVRVTN
jgi:hypothetical protein